MLWFEGSTEKIFSSTCQGNAACRVWPHRDHVHNFHKKRKVMTAMWQRFSFLEKNKRNCSEFYTTSLRPQQKRREQLLFATKECQQFWTVLKERSNLMCNYCTLKIKKICFSPKVPIQPCRPKSHSASRAAIRAPFNSLVESLYQPVLGLISALGSKSAPGNGTVLAPY